MESSLQKNIHEKITIFEDHPSSKLKLNIYKIKFLKNISISYKLTNIFKLPLLKAIYKS